MGSSSYITTKEGKVIQHTEYMAFGEVLFDEHLVSPKQPYLFNGKELDFETGLYYYGARYYDPKVSLWLNTDPLSGYNPIQETEHYIDGQHNGGVFNPMNMATYSYTYQNPVIYVDPNGKQNYFGYQYIQQHVKSSVNTLKQDVVNKYNNTKQSIVNTGRAVQNWARENKEVLLKGAEIAQDVGDGIAIAGYGLAVAGAPIAGVGAIPGAKVAAIGNAISSAGAMVELSTNLLTEDYSKAKQNAGYIIAGEVINKVVDKALPGPTPNISKEATIILKEGINVKTIVVERSIQEVQKQQQKQQQQQKNNKQND